MNYQIESGHIAEYDLYTLPGVNFTLRGPACPLDAPSPCISYLGAAQTFGAFCNYPFPNLIGAITSTRTLNFGRGGAGPDFFSASPAVIEFVNASDLCVVQVMSARSSVRNSVMESVDGLASVRFTTGPRLGEVMQGHHAFKELAKELGREAFFNLVRETQEEFIKQYARLASLIRVPKVLLYVGMNPPLADLDMGSTWNEATLVGQHPHMVTNAMVEALGRHFDRTFIVHGNDGFDNRMLNRFTGGYIAIKRSPTYTVTKHNVYISPHLHLRIALEIGPQLQGMIRKR